MPPKRTLDGKSIGLEEERGQIQKSPPSPWEKDQRICLINLSIEYILRDVGNFPGTSCAQCTVAQLDTVYKEINYSLLISFYIMDTKTILEPQFAKIPQLSQLEYMFLIFMKKRSVTSLFWFRKSVVTFDDPYCIYIFPSNHWRLAAKPRALLSYLRSLPHFRHRRTKYFSPFLIRDELFVVVA